MVGETFTAAWAEGARKYYRHAGTDEIEVVALENAWEEYAPVTLPPADVRPALPQNPALAPPTQPQRALLLQKSLERLTRPYRAMLAANPDNVRARMQLALLQGRHGLHDKALDGFADLLAENPDDSAVFNNRGNVYLLRDELGQALETYRQAEALAPNDPGIKVNMAITHYRAGDLEHARDKFAEAKRIDREIADRYQHLASVLSD
jgi:tetratricopeptide (TPR) repeat protein